MELLHRIRLFQKRQTRDRLVLGEDAEEEDDKDELLEALRVSKLPIHFFHDFFLFKRRKPVHSRLLLLASFLSL